MKPLLESDLTAPTWLRIKDHYEARLDELRVKNDTALSPEQTARLRGRIAEVKLLLALADPEPPPSEAADE